MLIKKLKEYLENGDSADEKSIELWVQKKLEWVTPAQLEKREKEAKPEDLLDRRHPARPSCREGHFALNNIHLEGDFAFDLEG